MTVLSSRTAAPYRKNSHGRLLRTSFALSLPWVSSFRTGTCVTRATSRASEFSELEPNVKYSMRILEQICFRMPPTLHACAASHRHRPTVPSAVECQHSSVHDPLPTQQGLVSSILSAEICAGFSKKLRIRQYIDLASALKRHKADASEPL